MSDTIRPFKISIADDELDFLRKKLDSARWPNLADNDGGKPWGTTYGPPIHWVKQLAKDWKEDFLPKWRDHEAKLNEFNHFIAKIDGLDIHFLHHKADPVEDQSKVIPLLCLHGWPGSFLEFTRVIPLLTAPSKHGLPGPAFDVIVPSLPGFTFSSPYPTAPFSLDPVAALLNTLVSSPSYLNYPTYAVQGGDWGAGVARIIAARHPQQCKVVHLNFLPAGPWQPFSWLSPATLMDTALKWAPNWLLGGDQGVRAIKTSNLYFQKQFSYMHLQQTKPISVGIGLDDSPVALLAWHAEKLGWWTATPPGRPVASGDDNHDYRYKVDESSVRDDLLLNISLYYFTRSSTSSSLIYKENDYMTLVNDPKNFIHQPLAVTLFPEELAAASMKPQFCRRTGNLRWYKVADRGAHFAAWQEPEIFSRHVRDAVSELWRA